MICCSLWAKMSQKRSKARTAENNTLRRPYHTVEHTVICIRFLPNEALSNAVASYIPHQRRNAHRTLLIRTTGHFAASGAPQYGLLLYETILWHREIVNGASLRDVLHAHCSWTQPKITHKNIRTYTRKYTSWFRCAQVDAIASHRKTLKCRNAIAKWVHRVARPETKSQRFAPLALRVREVKI